MARKTTKRHNLLESLLSKLSEEGRAEFAEFVACDRKLLDIQRWWGERGFTVGIRACSTWRDNHYQAGRRAKEIQAFVAESRGINALGLLEYAACEAAYAVSETRELMGTTCEDGGYTPKEVFLLLAAIKELRASAETLNNAKIRGDRTQDILSGAYELARKTLTAAKDHPNEAWIEELLNGELKATEDELRKEQLSDS